MNRIILELKLIGDSGIKIKLVHLDPRFISKDNMEFLNHYSEDKSFLLYSRADMTMTVNTLRLPDKDHYKPNQNVVHYFNDEKDRYKFLKDLRMALIDWSNNYYRFRYGLDYKRRNKKLIMSKEFWII